MSSWEPLSLSPTNPVKEFTTRQVIFKAAVKQPVPLSLLPDLMNEHKCDFSSLWVENLTQWDYEEEEFCIQIVLVKTVPNPQYEKQLEEYKAHLARQKADKLHAKQQAKRELEERIRKIDLEIEELG